MQALISISEITQTRVLISMTHVVNLNGKLIFPQILVLTVDQVLTV